MNSARIQQYNINMTVADTLLYLKNELAHRYSDSEIKYFRSVLLEAFIGFSSVDMLVRDTENLSHDAVCNMKDAVKRLLMHEPVQYITGYTYFLDYKFYVNSKVLIPRPETEELVRWVYEDKRSANGLAMLDIGTGSGCIPVALKKLMPGHDVYACDVSDEAIRVAQQNAHLNNAGVSFFVADILKDCHNMYTTEYNVIVSNPPYIPEEEKQLMHANVLNYEPHLALFTKGDPLVFYRAVKCFANKHLAVGGHIYLELNEFYAEACRQLFNSSPYVTPELKKDMQGKWRMLKVQKTNER